MRCVGRNHKYESGDEAVWRAVDDQFELAVYHGDDLLVRMVMLGKARARAQLHPRVRHLLRVNQPGSKSWEDLPHGQSVEGNQWHPVIICRPPNFTHEQGGSMMEVPVCCELE